MGKGILSEKKYKSFLRKYYSPDIMTWEWVLSGIIVLLVILSVSYQDTISITVWSTNLWDVIWEGRLTEFYEYTAQNIHNVPHKVMGCDIFAILPLSVWNIPIWIIQYFFHVEIPSNPFMIAWSKLGLEVASVAIAYMAYKMAFLLTNDRKRSMWAALITISSGVCIMEVGVAGQTDVFVALYGALSVYNMMKGDKRKSIIFAACSVAVKPFFVFAYLPLVLLTEKNILKAAWNCVLSLSVMVFDRIIGQAFSMYSESMEQGPSAQVLFNLFDVGIQSSFGKASLFLLGLMFICFVSYTTKTKSDNERNQYLIYISAAIFMLISVFSHTEFYRNILIMPYFPVLVVMNVSKFRLNLFLSFAYQFFHMLGLSCASGNTLSAYYMHGSVFSLVFKGSDYSFLKSSNSRNFIIGMDNYIFSIILTLSSALMVSAVILLLVINFPKFKKKFTVEEQGVFEKFDHGLLMLNAAVFLPFLIFMYYLYFYVPKV